MPERSVTLVNRLGLHARAAKAFVEVAGAYAAEITVTDGNREADGKSIMGMMMLGAPKGTELTLRAKGEDADAAMDALEALVAERFGEPD